MTHAPPTAWTTGRRPGRNGCCALALLLLGGSWALGNQPAAGPGKDATGHKAAVSPRVEPAFEVGDTGRDPFLPSTGAGGGQSAETPAAFPPKTGPVTLDEVVAGIHLQGFFRVGGQTAAMVNGQTVKAGTKLPVRIRQQECPVTVVLVDALAQKVLLTFEQNPFECSLAPQRPAGKRTPP